MPPSTRPACPAGRRCPPPCSESACWSPYSACTGTSPCTSTRAATPGRWPTPPTTGSCSACSASSPRGVASAALAKDPLPARTLKLTEELAGAARRRRDHRSAAAISLAGFPLDDIWHRIFGQDVTPVRADAPHAHRRRRAVHARRLPAAGRGLVQAAPGPGAAQRFREIATAGAPADRPVDVPGRVRLRRPAVPDAARAWSWSWWPPAIAAGDSRGCGVGRGGRYRRRRRLLAVRGGLAVIVGGDHRQHHAALPALPRRGAAGRGARAASSGTASAASPSGGRRRPAHRDGRPRRRIRLVARLGRTALAGRGARRGRSLGVRHRGGGRR